MLEQSIYLMIIGCTIYNPTTVFVIERPLTTFASYPEHLHTTYNRVQLQRLEPYSPDCNTKYGRYLMIQLIVPCIIVQCLAAPRLFELGEDGNVVGF